MRLGELPEVELLDDGLHLLHGRDPVAGPVKPHVGEGDRLQAEDKRLMVRPHKGKPID